MKEYKTRKNKGYEIQWFDADGNTDGEGARVVSVDNTIELAQYLARILWGSIRLENNPTVYLNGKRWCFQDYSEPVEIANPMGNNQIYLTGKGKDAINNYLLELQAKRKEILDAGKDTVDETELPTMEDILDDIVFQGLDEEGKYYNGWGVTDHYNSDYPLLLEIGKHFMVCATDTPKKGLL